MALAPYSSSTNTTPPKPPHHTVAQALAEHIAQTTGGAYNPPGPPGYTEPGYASSSNAAYYNPGAVSRLLPILNQYLNQKGSPLPGRAFVKKGKKYGIDPRLLVAITGAESSFGTSTLSGDYNPFGMGPGIDYNSWAQSIEAAAKNLNENYFGQGLDSIAEIGNKWAPPHAGNDPTGLNNNWVRNVTKFYKDLTGMRPDPPNRAGLAELFYQNALWNNQSGWFQDANLSSGHMTHIHEAATNPKILLRSLRVGQNKFGLTAGENPYVGQVYPVHAGQSKQYGDFSGDGNPSYHYRTFPGTFGAHDKSLGEAIDWTGGADSLNNFYKWLSDQYVGKGAYDYGTRGVAGGSSPITSAGTPYAARRQEQQAQNASSTTAQLIDSALSGGSSLGRRRKKKDEEVINQLLTSLGYGRGI